MVKFIFQESGGRKRSGRQVPQSPSYQSMAKQIKIIAALQSSGIMKHHSACRDAHPHQA